MDIGKARMTVAAPENDHLVADQIRRMVALFVRDVARGHPFVPSEMVYIGNIQCPDIVQSGLTIATAKDDQKLLEQDGSVSASRGRKLRWGIGDVGS